MLHIWSLIQLMRQKKPLFPLYSAVFKEKKKWSKMKQNWRSVMLQASGDRKMKKSVGSKTLVCLKDKHDSAHYDIMPLRYEWNVVSCSILILGLTSFSWLCHFSRLVLGFCKFCNWPFSTCVRVMAWRQWQKAGGSAPGSYEACKRPPSACVSWWGDDQDLRLEWRNLCVQEFQDQRQMARTAV